MDTYRVTITADLVAESADEAKHLADVAIWFLKGSVRLSHTFRPPDWTVQSVTALTVEKDASR